ncbi:recombinase family protein [Geodermatophilus sp. SYSU D00700]
MRLVAYLRVSTNVQAERGFGLDIQDAQVRQWAQANHHEIAAVCRDKGVSGTTDAVDRPGLACALAGIPGDADAVVVARLDRPASSRSWIAT